MASDGQVGFDSPEVVAGQGQDAALVLMAPADQDAFVSDVRFAAPGAHWAGAFSSLCVDSVLAEASKMAERVGRYNLARTTPIQLCDLAGPAAVLTRAQWAVACAIDGTVRSHVPAPPPTPVLSPTAVLPPPSSVTRLPHRPPAGRRAPRPVMSAPVWINGPEMTETAPPADYAAAQPDLLRQVLDGLRKLS